MAETTEAKVCAPGELWVPGTWLSLDYPVPTNEELTNAWSDYLGEPAKSLEGVYGTYRPLGNMAVSAMASVDLCEVVRESSKIIDLTLALEPTRRAQYKYGTWFEELPKEYEQATVTSILQTVMNEGMMVPDPAIEDIREIMQRWRKNGVYVSANTATLPGCELATINLFLAKHLPGCFDALVLPRNHDGTGSMTKAKAFSILAQEVGIDESSGPLVKIDDATHHIESFLAHYGEHEQRAFFIPAHPQNESAPEELRTATSLEAFEKATEFFQKQGVNV